ncbi:putative alpha mannosyltransferase subunit protein [Botrytis fragariae]|uniref:Mannosyltransferase n=1 Tax=Botrytis fragariae TaxID=1964551 RepID=A0A8H6AVF9_9HELO|nr:putative alpha mannosyltransferase subunit protein [Botrytis fragariae]KAF5874303.1 putative alpha mannosyltransferase subunit protein [Botrytis fragariae]
MKGIDILLTLSLPTLILVHLLIAPYTKVEESFNIQATHDILNYGLPISNISSTLDTYDHTTFSGAVPRTFFGALSLAAVSKPIILLTQGKYAQVIVRGVLGLFNAACLIRYRNGLTGAFGVDVGRWYMALQVTQFHVLYYASRTLPNMFAFGLTTLAFTEFLPATGGSRPGVGIFLFVFAGVVFRSEIALLLFTQLAYLLVLSRISLKTVIPAGIQSAILALAVSVPIDSYFWQKPLWPELAGFYFNAIQGKSSEWGTSPFLHYFTSLLPRLLMNPLILLLLHPLALTLPATKHTSKDLIVPSLLFVAIYSLQPHKESRFIIYVVPPLTAAASLSASYIWTRRSKSWLYTFGSLALLGSVALSFVASSAILMISSLNYPGGDALSQLHTHIIKDLSRSPRTQRTQERNISIHMDVLSCMTGITRFQQYPSLPLRFPQNQNITLNYDKTEDSPELGEAAFWMKFDYALMEEPGLAIGKWDVLDTVFAYAGIEILRPGDGSSFSERLEGVYRANNVTVGDEGAAPSAEDVKRIEEEGTQNVEKNREGKGFLDLKTKLMFEEMNKFGTYNLLRDAGRLVTGGWWIGPRMEGRIRILRRIGDEKNWKEEQEEQREKERLRVGEREDGEEVATGAE